MYALAILTVFAMIVGLLARNRRMGFWGGFFLSMLVTPVIALAVVFLSSTQRKYRR